MRQSVWHQLLIATVAAIVFFDHLGAMHLWDQDEAFFAQTAVEMQSHNQWVVPYFNGDLFAHKPPLMFWMMRSGFALFGHTEFAARFWSAVFGLLTTLLMYHLGRRMFNARVGLWAGLAMATAVDFVVVGHAATPDSYLVFFCTLSLYCFARTQHWDGNENAGSELAAAPLPWASCAAMYAAMGAAVLVKGPIGILLPGCTIGLYLLLAKPVDTQRSEIAGDDRLLSFARRFAPGRILRTFWQLRPLTGLAVVLCVAGPWFLLVGVQTGGEFLWTFFGVQNIGRFMSAMDNHSGGIWYYFPAILIGFFPWSIFMVPTAIDLFRRCRQHTWSRGALFLVCWATVVVGFFSIASTKLPSYVLPAYPALALATACFLDRWLCMPEAVSRWWPRCSFGVLLSVGIVAVVGAAEVLSAGGRWHKVIEKFDLTPEISSLMPAVIAVGTVLIVGAMACLALTKLKQRAGAVVALAVTGLAFLLALGVVARQVDRFQPSPSVAAAIRGQSNGDYQLA
ncbi:MAG TPA: glycosyltransferase family 39 protein, partial [Pirellulales bacterium]